MGHTMVLAHGEFFVLSLAIPLIICSLSYPSNTCLCINWHHINLSAYIVLLKPRVALKCASGEKIISRTNPVTLYVLSWRMPLGGDLEEFFDRV